MSAVPSALHEARAALQAEGFDLSMFDAQRAPLVVDAGEDFTPDLASYDRIVVGFSGGKDCEAAVLKLLEKGVPPEKIELHHHLVDGPDEIFMDWPVTEDYCRAFAAAFHMKITFSWREGGMRREALRDNAPTAPVYIPDGDGHRAIGGNGPLGTRWRFPQVSASLNVRWCSAYLKIMNFAGYLANHPQFLGSRTLVITGERAEESRSRANYKVFEPHRGDTRNSKRVPRHIDHWRPVHGCSEQQVWNIIRRHRVCPHPAYFLGPWSRLSCRACIFGSKNQWAGVRKVAPAQFNEIAGLEHEFKVTIHRKHTVVELADMGAAGDMDPKWVALANSRVFDHSLIVDNWTLPKGAFGDASGPT